MYAQTPMEIAEKVEALNFKTKSQSVIEVDQSIAQQPGINNDDEKFYLS